MKPLLKDPLVHFLAAGLIIFSILSIAKPPSADREIVVTRDVLLSFIQFRSKAFEPEVAASILDGFSDEERTRLIDDYVREEALHREAKALALDVDDYVIRQRLVQKFEFLTQSPSFAAPDDESLAAYYEENKSDYLIPPGVTLTHVFVSGAVKEASIAERANDLLTELVANDAQFQDATAYGDRFLFHTNYVERTQAYVKSHFGQDATQIIFDETTPLGEWIGPVYSSHGAHLVFIAARSPQRLPGFEEVRSQILSDYNEAERRRINEALVNSVIENYEIVLDLETPTSINSN